MGMKYMFVVTLLFHCFHLFEQNYIINFFTFDSSIKNKNFKNPLKENFFIN